MRLVGRKDKELRYSGAGRHGRYRDGGVWWQVKRLFGFFEGAGVFLVGEKAVGG